MAVADRQNAGSNHPDRDHLPVIESAILCSSEAERPLRPAAQQASGAAGRSEAWAAVAASFSRAPISSLLGGGTPIWRQNMTIHRSRSRLGSVFAAMVFVFPLEPSFTHLLDAHRRQRQLLQLPQVRLGEEPDPLLADRGEAQVDDAVIIRVTLPLDQARPLGAVDQSDGAVVAKRQVVGRIADRRPARTL